MFAKFLPSMLDQLPRLLAGSDGWSGWPFSGYGYEGGFWPVVARFVFIALLLGGIALLLRLLFGPKGPLRGEGWETIQEANKRREAEKLEAEQQAQRGALKEEQQSEHEKESTHAGKDDKTH